MKNTPCPDKFIFNQKTKHQKWASSDDKNNICYSWPCPKSSLVVNSNINLYMAVAFQVAMVTWHTGTKQPWAEDNKIAWIYNVNSLIA